LLAEIRQRQHRWADSVVQWEQVARIRSLEPTGLLRLCEVLIHDHRPAEARAVLEKLQKKTWPDRFETGPEDVREKIRVLQKQVEGAKGP